MSTQILKLYNTVPRTVIKHTAQFGQKYFKLYNMLRHGSFIHVTIISKHTQYAHSAVHEKYFCVRHVTPICKLLS